MTRHKDFATSEHCFAMSTTELSDKALQSALQDARERGLPDGWTVKLDKRRRRKWISPTGKSCDSIPKAIAISIEIGLLPADTQVPKSNAGRPRKRKEPPQPPSAKQQKAKKASPERPSTPDAIALSFDSDEEDPGPESDPETSLDVPVCAKSDLTRPTTVHWDPSSPDGSKVGWKVRLWDEHDNEWRDGRVLLYDPYTHKHKVQYGDKPRRGERVDTQNCIWVRLAHEVYQCAQRLVWAHVKGFAWWPAMVMECDPPSFGGQTNKKGSIFVNFFGSDDVATLRDCPECVRTFDGGKVDSVIAKNKKKRNASAVKLACDEQVKIRQVRNDATIHYAEKAFGLVSNQGMNLVGKKVEIFRNDVNYPYGEVVEGKVRQYSTETKKWLVCYDLSQKTSSKYDSSWVNFRAKDCDYKILDKKKAVVPTNEDLVPFIHGFEELNLGEGKSSDDDDEDKERVVTRLLTQRCRGCVDYILQSQSEISCTKCGGSYHPGCIDPPMEPKTLQRIVAEDEDWICPKCIPCNGCFQLDIGFGVHTHPIPPSISLPEGVSLNLCSMCVVAYDKKRFCPNCTHTWDDVRYQKVQKQIRWQEKKDMKRPASKSGEPTKKKRRGRPPKRKPFEDKTESVDSTSNDEDTPDSGVTEMDRSWFYPDTTVWGYTEEAMLLCESCKLWVHAACGGLDEEEYDLTSDGDHPIYSKEFLCRVCCKSRCLELIEELKKQDNMSLFAAPVTEQMAPTYHDVIKNPMDLKTMTEKAENGDYLNYAWVREDFELMVLNALTFNSVQSKYWDEAKRYRNDCLKKVFASLGKAAPPGKYAETLNDTIVEGKRAIQLEAEREKEDETAEKKDLVAGSEVATIKLPPLRDPPDQPSCIPFTEVKLKSSEAYYNSWMECCFACGSSGAADTLLFCVDCGEAFHSFCADAPIHSMDAASVSGWRCPNCKICEISGDVPKDECNMLFCEMCDRAFSLDLLDPPLKTAPPGLWICGQCVDCKTCNNTAEKDGASLKYWSRDPEKCYRCGGCKGIVDTMEHGGRCRVCSKLTRAHDNDMVQCMSCESNVHLGCDALAREFQAAKGEKADSQEHEKYQCPLCRKKHGNKDKYKMIRQSLQEQAWLAVLQGRLMPPDSSSLVENHERLCNEIDWRLRNMWRDDYRSVIKEGFRIMAMVKNQFSHINELQDLFATGSLDLPAWMGARAARFVRFAKEKHWEDDGFPKKDIKTLVLIAKLSAAFMKVACRAMGLKTRNTVKCYDRMISLLMPPDGNCGIIDLPIDIVRVEGNRNVIQADDWKTRYEPDLQATFQGKEAFSDGDGADSNEDQTSPAARKEVYKIASPIIGWNSLIETEDEENRWKDPRSCCLCHMCGDDDAGFPDGEMIIDSVDTPRIARVGRLLPMADGYWVHASCAMWSSEVWEAASGGTVHAMDKARSRGAQLKCFGCGRQGATVGCFKVNCSHNYHFPCAKACGAVFTDNQQMFCADHKAEAIGLLPRESFEYMKPLVIDDEKKVPFEKDSSDGSDGGLCSRVGAITVHSLGVVDQYRDGFHSEKYVTPANYFATRIFWSSRSPKTRTVYVLKIEDCDGTCVFSIVPGDDPNAEIRGISYSEVYNTLMEQIKALNEDQFSSDLLSKLPVPRKRTKNAYGLNGPQFFGFGLDHIRRALETSPGIEAVVAPLTKHSLSYRFCFVQPSIDTVMALQRKRAAVAAERALENSSGSARTEGMSAVARSGGSGRITRILVRSAEEEVLPDPKRSDADKIKADRLSNQKKYRAMKAVPFEQRLAARRSHIHGWGLFTKVDLPKDSMIVEYMGETVRQCIADKREKGYETSGIGSCYMFRLDLQRVIDATQIGCMARFMNHCCRPNAYAKVINVDTEQGPDKKIVVFANRDINANEEITYDYKFPVEDGSLRCTCGAPNCIGRMN